MKTAKKKPSDRKAPPSPAKKPLKKSPEPPKAARVTNPAPVARESRARSGPQLVQFEFHDPKAKEVYIVGSFNGWEPHATPMKKGRDGTWTVSVQLSRGRHEYRILADGQWRDDPMANTYERNPFGGRNAVLEVRA